MTQGIRVELAVGCDTHCPVAAVSRDVDGAVDDISRAVVDGQRVDEYRVPSDTPTDGTPVFETREGVVYRTAQPCDAGCPCEVIEAQGCPVADVRGVDGRLVVAFYADDRATVRAVVGALAASFDVDLLRLVAGGTGRGDEHGGGEDTTVVDRSRLTARQREVVETAHRMGYFEYPREATAETVASDLDVSPSAFAETLRAAERSLLDELFPDSTGATDSTAPLASRP
ncbi:helix-turn-helix domain-containing protein [Salinigranum sp. GCM10025319]|uniref:helix-turn-helix domain-containing protein n=1 Tax=Salinigranum sp. GCM10025319 TaxID=3252687 RepID=UPI00361B9200